MGRRLDDWDLADLRGETPPRRQVDPAVVARVGSLLADRLAHLDAESATIRATERPRDEGPRPQYGKRIGDHTSDALESRRNGAALDTLAIQIADVTRAREKLRDGSYGLCDRCRAEIAADRLEALPWASRCVECAVLARRGIPRQ